MSDDPNLAAEEDDQPSAPFWMTTFSDMATILLAFFVMIVAMSEVEVKKFKEAMSYFQGRTGILASEAVTTPVRSPVKDDEYTPTYEEVERFEQLQRYLDENDLNDKVKTQLSEHGMHVVMMDSVMFAPGSTTLIEPSRTILALVAGVLQYGVRAVVVEGHTDDSPTRGGRYPSNWELSSARASSVVRFLLDLPSAIEPERYVAVGYASNHPIATNDTRAGRGRNRRVELLFSWKPWNPTSRQQVPMPEIPVR